MAGLGLGLNVSSGTISSGVQAYLYLTSQDGDILHAQQDRGSPESPSLLTYEPNADITSDTLAGPKDLMLTQDGKVIATEDGRLIGIEDKDLPFARYITQDGNLIVTQDDQPLVAQEIQPDSTIQEFITQNGRFLFTQSGDQITTT